MAISPSGPNLPTYLDQWFQVLQNELVNHIAVHLAPISASMQKTMNRVLTVVSSVWGSRAIDYTLTGATRPVRKWSTVGG